MSKIRLGVNINHVATVRNARGESYPSPLRAALLAQKSGADSIPIHLREDRRHINELDLKQIKSKARRKIKRNLGLASFIFHRKLRFRSIFLKFASENLNAAFWENPEECWSKFCKNSAKF